MNKMITKLLLGVLFMVGAVNAYAQPSLYSFAGSTGTYSAISGTTLTFTSQDDASTGNLPIGFTFNYNSINQTVFAASTNGLLILGQTTDGAGLSTNALASTLNTIAGLWEDNNMTGGTVQYITTGTAPNRVLTVQYTGMHVGGGGSPTNPTIDMQILLYETSNIIQVIYGATSATLSGTSASIGISGNSGNFLSVTPTSATTPYATTSNVTENTSISAATFFPTGTTYTFTPPPPCVAPTSIATSVTTTPGVVTIAGSFTAAPPTTPTGYLVVRTPTNVQPTPVTGTTYTVGSNAIGYIEYVNAAAGSWTSTGLTASTPYYYWVFSYNNTACTGGPVYSATASTATATTTACSIVGTYDVGPGAVSGYLTLKAAVDAVVSNGVTGPVIFELNAAYASGTDAVFPIVLGNVPCASATNTITVRIAAGAGAKTITGSNTTAIFDINGGNYWRIDGRQGGAGSIKDLTISNTSTATGGVAIRFINEASNTIVNYSILKSLYPSTTSGVVLFSTTTGANGNDNNTIDNCDIDGGAGATASPTLTATNGIYGLGTITTLLTFNNNNVISNNNIFNFFTAGTSSAGILLSGGNSDWTIQNNKIYQTSARVFTTTALTYFGISQTNNGMSNMLVSGNIIGFASNTGTGVTNISGSSNMVRGIRVFPGNTVVSTLQNNVVTAITQSTSRASTTAANGAFYGIAVNNSGLVNIIGNSIGSLNNSSAITITQTSTTSGTVPSAGIYDEATSLQNITNNNIGTMIVTQTATQYGGLRGIHINVATGVVTNVTGNTIGGASVGSGLTLTGGLGQLIGIHAALGVNNISSNTVRFLTNQGSANTGTGASAQLIGISNNSTDAGVSAISQNTIHNINSSATAAANFQTAGYYNNGSTTGNATVSRNYIHTITSGSTGTAAVHYGMNFGGGICNVYNNLIAIGTGMTNNIGITGINDVGTTNNFYFNSVYIGGSVTSGSLNTFAFNSSVTTNPRKFQNNIFANLRTNGGAGKSYAVAVSGSVPNPSGLTIGNNDYWVTGTGTVLGRYNAADVVTLTAWQTAVGQDAQSVNVDPAFIAPTAASPDLHITSGASTLESAALSIAGISNDFDNDTRPGTPSGSNSGVGPDIGADEFNGLNPSVCSGTPAAGGTATSSVPIICSGSNVNFTVTGATAGVGIQYQWQSSPAGANAWADVVGATSTTSSIPVTGNTDFRCKVICAASTLFTTSTVVTVNGVNCQYNIVKSAATFTSISGTGTSMSGWRASATNTDDNLSTSQPIGFSFPYKGVNYSNFSVSTNGYLTFNVGTSATGTLTGAYGYSNTQFSASGGTVTSLAPFYEDQVTPGNPGTAAGLAAAMKYQVDGTVPNRVLTVEWIGMETFGNAGPNLNYQVKIYETTGVIEYVYGTMEGFNGTADYTYSYTMGVNGATISATPTVLQLQTQQTENVQNFSAVPANSLTRVPDCNIKYTFTPNTYGTADPAPGVPANDEPGVTATTLSVNASPCVSLCGTYYTSKNATASAGITVCGAGTPGTPDDDVWFKFVATATDQTITVRGAGGYDAVVQLFSDAGTTSVTCVNATGTGFTETINATGLTPANTYYIRVYHAAAGSGTNGDFSICINEVIAAPANDNICAAVTLIAGVTCSPVSGTTIAATASPQAVCGGTADDDVWYKWTAVLATDSIKVQGAAGFNAHVEVFSSSDNTCTGTLTSLSCINATSTGGLEIYAPTGLIPGNTYFVRVYHTASGTGTGSFTICALAPPPACVTGTTPANATSVDATAGTTLGWSAAAGATGYDVYFDTNNPPTTLVSPNQAGLTYATGVLAVNQVYYWRIISRNAAGTSSGCSIQNINTNPPACIPAPTIPVNAANICALVTATTLSWPASPGATGYDVYLNLGAGPAVTLVSSNQAGLTFNAGVLAAGAYVWRIEPRNNNGVNTGCNNWTFTVIAAPTINITPAGPVSICAPATQTLTLESTSASTPTYQWKNGGVNIPAETGTSYTAAASGSYSLQVTDGVTGCISVSNVVIVTVSAAPVISSVTASPATICSGGTATLTANVAPAATYCTAQSTVDCFTADEYIGNVTFSTINNSSTCAASAAGYTDYTAISATVTPGSYTMSVTNGNGYTGDQCKAWIDLNRNGLFTDPGEEFTSTGGPTSFSIAVTIPGTAYNGPTRMRVRVTYTTGMAPCGTSGFGETEDYTLNISGATDQYTYLWSPATFLSSTTTNPTTVTGATATTIYNVQVISGACNVNANVTLTVGNTWIGTTADAATAGNWTCGLPDGTTDVIIPTTPSGGNMPLLSGPLSVRSVNLQPSAVLGLGAQTLTINGAVTGSGTFSGSATSGLVIAGTAGTINFTSGSQLLKDLTLNAGATATLGTALDITAGAAAGTVTVATGATLTTGGNMTLKSNAGGTARVGNSPGTISGTATVERYINNIGRKWRLLSGKTIGGTQTIRNAWQENGGTASNLGTWITKPGGGSGYDGASTNAGLLRFDVAGPAWQTVAATNAGSINDEQGYMLFVRGDRNDIPGNLSNSPTVLRTTGTLNQQAQTAIPVLLANPGYTLIGNPFASSIDFENFYTTTNLQQDFYIWDANLSGSYGVGGYRLVSRDGAGNYTVTPNGGIANEASMRYISSGQAFFVKATGGNASLALDESSKSAGAPEVLPIVGGAGDQQLLVNLAVKAGAVPSVFDGIRVRFDDAYSAGVSDDAEKISNFSENLAIMQSNRKWVLERRPLVSSTDTIWLRLGNTAVKNYQFQLATINFDQPGVKAYLQDAYLGTNTAIDLAGNNTDINFSITSDAASANPDRFRIVFAAAPQPQTNITVTAAQKGNAVEVEWKAANQYNMKQYEVERSADGVNYTRVNTQAAMGTNGSDVVYRWLDVNPVVGSLQQPVDNFYRIRSVDVNAAVKIAGPVSVKMGRGDAAITAYPNPVTGHRMSLKFTGMEKGMYEVRLFSTTGQLVYTRQVNHTGGTATQSLVFDRGIAKGTYRLQVTKPDYSKTMQTIIITD